MAEQKLETRVRELEDQVMTMRNHIRTLQTLLDIEEIMKLQRVYGFYLEHWMAQEIIDLFSDGPNVALEFPEGKYLTKMGVKNYFENMKHDEPEFLHLLMQLCPVIDVDPDGKTARGRWYSCGAAAIPRGPGIEQSFGIGIYENEYVKEGGKWKIKRLKWQPVFDAKPGAGFVKPERVAAVDPESRRMPSSLKPDVPDTRNKLQYPSGYIFPFHYNHPVTGKKTSENEINVSLGLKEGNRKRIVK